MNPVKQKGLTGCSETTTTDVFDPVIVNGWVGHTTLLNAERVFFPESVQNDNDKGSDQGFVRRNFWHMKGGAID